MNFPDFNQAFQAGTRLKPESDDLILTPYKVGDLVLNSGKLVACDPLTLCGWDAFTISLPPGRYPVILSIANIQNNHDRRVAYAMLQLIEETAVRWEMAVIPGDDLSSLKEGEFLGYGVDSGTGCFMDAEVAEILETSTWDSETYEETLTCKLEEALEKNRRPTWCWANMRVDETEANVIAFSSGWGDGIYPTYFGYDREDNIINAVTNFLG